MRNLWYPEGMPVNSIGVFSTCASILAFATAAFASCEGIIGPASSKDSALLWRSEAGWQPAEKLNDSLRKGAIKNVNFAYVVKENNADEPRAGAIAIKSGFTAADQSLLPDYNRVTLYRPRIKDACSNSPYRPLRSEVSKRAYDEYHEDNKVGPFKDIFAKFHIKYTTRKGCRATDDNSPDGVFAWMNYPGRSNRSQFSFNPETVKRGQASPLLSWLGPRKATAGELVSGRSVQIRTYSTSADGLACVRFTIKVGPGAFLRVNDLEKRTLFGGDGARWDRSN